jgi:hypothetical protein
MAEAVLDAPASNAKRTNGKPPIATRRKSVA